MLKRNKLLIGRFHTRDVARALALIAFLLVFFFWPLPYLILSPGEVLDLSSVVHVEDAYHDELGSFLMTTVHSETSTPYTLLVSEFKRSEQVVREQDLVPPEEGLEQYFDRQKWVMHDSQENALIVAFRMAGLPIQVENIGVLVTSLIPDTPAAQVLKEGDVIKTVGDTPTPTVQALIEALGPLPVGTRVKLLVERDGKTEPVEVEVVDLPASNEGRGGVKGMSAKGIGLFSPMTKRRVEPPLTVTFDTEKIGGPSAGLMFALELINQLIPEDLTRGYTIAGTGTIDEEGRIGRIGGIRFKVLGAHAAGATYFLAPDDTPPPGAKSNYEEAKETNEAFSLGMTIVPVKTIEDALRFLRSLPPH
ncbi:MAG: Lon-like protease with PDZ domain [Candidatus Carbobacillus altaicus]|uniref:endopeptidase La n=1 Tax=Candidatus Carbonibacillus altaicus TaxID=2163959 RepID=A0A2R6Y278_9BACL|nr:MAG: Lon-like protease with PDZ domain [Candidatus Carbobacillus altaicus]